MTFRDPKEAFENAISSGALSVTRGNENYAGHFMYMHSDGPLDYFKNIDTRKYVSVENKTKGSDCEPKI